jgi:polar amino acid transport system permease protein
MGTSVGTTSSFDLGFWFAYFTNGKHLQWFASVQFTLFAAVAGAAIALLLGLIAAAVRNAPFAPARLLAAAYINSVRGIPDVLFFLFFPLAFEQLLELILASQVCDPNEAAIRVGQWPPCVAANLHFDSFGYLLLASVSLGIIYGASSASVIHGALRAVPRGQLEAARSFGFSSWQVLWHFHIRQMWIYALPGLSNLWMLLIKSTSLLSLLQIVDIVTRAKSLGAPNFSRSAGLVHGDWRWAYYLVLLLFYIALTFVSEKVFAALIRRSGRGVIRPEGT